MEPTTALVQHLDQLGAWGILRTDNNLRIVGWNRWLEKHSGKKADDVLGQHLFDVYPDLVERSLDRHFLQAIEGQAGILSQRFHRYLLPMPPTVANSTLMHMQQTARISPFREGDVANGTITLIEDVTERVVTEQDLREQTKRLEDANRHKDEFLAMLAHELRNPLAPIRNAAHLLDTAPGTSAEARQTCAMIERQVAHMTRLIDDLLDVSRMARGKVRLQKERCDLVTLLRQVASDYRSILADSGLELFVDLPTEPCWIHGDCIRLSQIFSNLLQNASKFTNSGGQVRLKAEENREREEFVITVADTGIGMTPEILSQVFEAFSQAESSLARSKGGLGLGLALVKGLTQLHKGEVEAHSEGVGQGSVFTLRLPITEAIAPAPDPESVFYGTRRDFHRVLVIEDNRDTAISLKMLIQRLGLEVDLAFSGTEGIDMAKRLDPDVILCDIGLPGMDGFAVARAIRSDEATRDAYLIAQSGYGQADDIRRAHEAGFDSHVTKPVEFSELSRLLKGDKP